MTEREEIGDRRAAAVLWSAAKATHDRRELYRMSELMLNDTALWNKCANCGEPYAIGTEEWPEAGDTVCSDACSHSYIAYLNGVIW